MAKLKEEIEERVIDKADAIDVLDRTIDFVRNCDNKASILLGIFGVVFTIILTADGINNLADIFSAAATQMSFCKAIYLTLMAAAIVVIIFGLSQIIRVLNARVDFSKKEGIDNDSKIFFEHIRKNTSYLAYKTKLLNMTDEEFLNDITSQIYINSCICSDKYKNYKRGLTWSIVGFAAFIVLWAVGIIIF